MSVNYVLGETSNHIGYGEAKTGKLEVRYDTAILMVSLQRITSTYIYTLTKKILVLDSCFGGQNCSHQEKRHKDEYSMKTVTSR